jgi:hypothetical protein
VRNWIVLLLLAVLLVAGCASTPAAAGERTISVQVAGGEVTPPAGRVSVPAGTRVHLTVDSDVPDFAHVHGYDILFEIGPDGSGTTDFTADITGVFHVELHEADRPLFELAVS